MRQKLSQRQASQTISIPDDKAEKIATVGDAISYIEENAK